MTAPTTEAAVGATAIGLAAHANALQGILTDLSTLTVSQLVSLFRQYGTRSDFPQLVKTAFPQIVEPHAHAAAQITAQWYDELHTSTFHATPTVNLPAERMDKTVDWALYAPTETKPSHVHVTETDLAPTETSHIYTYEEQPDASLSRLSGSAKRMVYDASRDTVTTNTSQQGVHFARYASANACAFCRLLATRTGKDLYSSEKAATTVVGVRGRPQGTRALGAKYHDHCRCVAVPVPDGQTYTPPDYTKQWQQDYTDARKGVREAGKTANLNNILSHMRANTDAH